MIASKRAFATSIVESDGFLDLPATAQLLYFHLNLCADNDGVVDAPKTVMRKTRTNVGDMRSLLNEGLVIWTEDAKIVIITDWLEHNKLRFDNNHYKHGRYYPLVQTLLPERSGSDTKELPLKTKQANIQQQYNDVVAQDIYERLRSTPWYISDNRARELIETYGADRCAAFEEKYRAAAQRREIGAGLLISFIENPNEPPPPTAVTTKEHPRAAVPEDQSDEGYMARFNAAHNAKIELLKKLKDEK